jgi:2-polyprenyl-3-methyl-5-hydroxy-6-metoxy-1,4-benzoquinol methylase
MTHPPVQGEIWERRRDARRVEITEAGRADVRGRWLDTRERRAWPARGFTERFRPALDNADYRAALPERRRRLIDEQRDLLTGRTVLELGPHTGGLTARIARYAKRITAIEGNRHAVEVLARRLGTRVQIVQGDLHRELWRRRRGAYDVIVCAGVLYHSAHPFWILEGIARLAPRLMLIDTLNPGRRTWLEVPPTRRGPLPSTRTPFQIVFGRCREWCALPALQAVPRPRQRGGASCHSPSVRISSSAFDVRTTPGRIR